MGNAFHNIIALAGSKIYLETVIVMNSRVDMGSNMKVDLCTVSITE